MAFKTINGQASERNMIRELQFNQERQNHNWEMTEGMVRKENDDREQSTKL